MLNDKKRYLVSVVIKNMKFKADTSTYTLERLKKKKRKKNYTNKQPDNANYW